MNEQKSATPINTVSTSHHASIINPSLIGRAAVSPTLARSMPTLFSCMFFICHQPTGGYSVVVRWCTYILAQHANIAGLASYAHPQCVAFR